MRIVIYKIHLTRHTCQLVDTEDTILIDIPVLHGVISLSSSRFSQSSLGSSHLPHFPIHESSLLYPAQITLTTCMSIHPTHTFMHSSVLKALKSLGVY